MARIRDWTVQQASKHVVAPIVLRLLSPLDSYTLAKAIREDQDVNKALKSDGQQLNNLKRIASEFPAHIWKQALPYFIKESWTRWFIEQHLRKKRPDLYIAITHTPKGYKWTAKQVRNIAETITASGSGAS